MHILMFDIQIKIAPVSQLDREVGFYPNGCGFESCRGRQFLVRGLMRNTIYSVPIGIKGLAREPFTLLLFVGEGLKVNSIH